MATTSPSVRTSSALPSWARNLILALVTIYVILLIGPIAGFDAPRIWQQIVAEPKTLIQVALVGLANGSIIAIIALGYTLVYGIIELINFAHADVFMLGAFMSLTVFGALGVNQQSGAGQIVFGVLATLLIAMGFCALLNASIERLAYRRLRNAPRLAPLISAIGVSFILQNLGLFWGGLRIVFPVMGVNSAAPKNFPQLLPEGILFQDGPIIFRQKDLIIILASVAFMIALRLFVQYTRLGKAMRATAQNRDAAKIMGINVDTVIAFTFLLGGGLAGVAGLLVGLYNGTIVFNMGLTAGLRAFTAAVLGGIGNITGAMLGGFLIGLLAAFSDVYFSSRWTNAWVFAILVVILVFRPLGLLGEAGGEKA